MILPALSLYPSRERSLKLCGGSFGSEKSRNVWNFVRIPIPEIFRSGREGSDHSLWIQQSPSSFQDCAWFARVLIVPERDMCGSRARHVGRVQELIERARLCLESEAAGQNEELTIKSLYATLRCFLAAAVANQKSWVVVRAGRTPVDLDVRPLECFSARYRNIF